MTQSQDLGPGKVLLSGASGLLGTALRNGMHAEGLEIVRLVRRVPKSKGELAWDPAGGRGPEDVSALEGLRAAIHLSGANVAAHRWTPAYRREIETSRVESTRGLARVLARLKRPPEVWLVASATGIYGDRGDEVLTESSLPGSGFLAEVCQAWEAAAKPAVAAGIRVVHLRLGVVLEAGGGALGKMAPLFRLGLGGRLGSGRQWMSWIAMEDAVAAMLFLLKTPRIAGPINLTAPCPVTNAEFTRAMGRALHRPALLPVPAFALRLALGPMADEALLSSARVIPKQLTDAGFRFAQPELEQMLRAALRK